MAQILNISLSKRLPAVTLVGAGDTQQVVCTPMVYLSATISGNLNGHTTEWEQVNGTPTVDILTVDALNAYYEVSGSPGSDKTFRFWIDKGRSYQQYLDVIIRTTPADIVPDTLKGGSLNTDLSVDAAFTITVYNLTADFAFDYNIPFNSQGESFSSDFYLAWNLPGMFLETTPDSERARYRAACVGTRLEYFNDTSWTELSTVGINGLRTSPIGNATRLRLGALYNLNGAIKPVYGPWFTIDGNNARVILAKTVVTPTQGATLNTDNVVTRIVYTLTLLDYNENVTASVGGAVANDVTTTRLVYIVEPKMYDDSASGIIAGGALSVNYSITRVTGGSIGG